MDLEGRLGLNFGNQRYVIEQYAAYQKDPNNVPEELKRFFEGVEFSTSSSETGKKESSPELRILRLLDSYKRYGHLASITNPMKHDPDQVENLSLKTNGFSEEEKNREFPTLGILEKPSAPLSEIVSRLNQVYCRTIGFECYGLQDIELENWFHEQILRFRPPIPKEEKMHALKELCKAKLFEEFLHKRFIGAKRFSLEGSETLIPILGELFDEATKKEYHQGVICMAHRGRLNVLCNIMQKPYEALMHEFNTESLPEEEEGMGDVKYHKGFHSKFSTHSNRSIDVLLAPNPSHLESVDPVMMGMAKGIMQTGQKVLPIMIHGDAAIAGQGVVYEVMQFSKLKGYSIDGIIHIVINNQIGFTATPEQSRSTRYCTDIAKTFGNPVIHVNAEDIDASLYAIELALETRDRFGVDVFIDLGCYRQYGHNEGDEPVFTNPHLYSKIKTKEHLYRAYQVQLVNEKLIDDQGIKNIEEGIKTKLGDAFEKAKQLASKAPKEISCPMYNYLEMPKEKLFEPIETKISIDTVKELANRFCTIPEDFHAHPKIRKIYEERKNILLGPEEEKKVDWGCGETLAYASLLGQGISVRISGQDSQRGTFSHRHSVLYDQKEEKTYIPLESVSRENSTFQIYNSALSEYGALGYEFGYSLTRPNDLVIWEAQFGDFVNGAQIIIDQYIASSETKWNTRSRLVMLLPHGYEGMGSEHSSCRVERMLQLSALYNMNICYPTSPGQLFHLLRRQVLSDQIRPLVVLTPKSMLRYPPSFTCLKEITEGEFQDIIDDTTISEKVTKILFCSGKIYYELLAKREGMEDVAIIRIEHLYPLNIKRLREILGRYPEAKRFAWVQEEPSNQGFWDYIRPYFAEILEGYKKLEYIGRVRSSSPASGFVSVYKKEQKEIIDKALRE